MPALTTPVVLNDGATDHTLKPVSLANGIAQFSALYPAVPGAFDFLSIGVAGQPGANHKVRAEVRLPEVHIMPDGTKEVYVDIAKIEIIRHRMNTSANGLKLRTMVKDLLGEAVLASCVDDREHVW